MTPLIKINGLDWTLEDLHKKWSRSFILGKIEDYSGLIYLDDVNTTTIWRDAVGNSHDCPLGNILVEEDHPSPCITNYGESAFLFTYNPERQWKRGISNENTFYFHAPDLNCHIDTVKDWALLAFCPSHSHMESSFNQLKEGNIKARALNNRYWLIKNKDGTIRLYRRLCFMGSFIGKKFFIQPTAKIFNEELSLELPILKEKYAYLS